MRFYTPTVLAVAATMLATTVPVTQASPYVWTWGACLQYYWYDRCCQLNDADYYTCWMYGYDYYWTNAAPGTGGPRL
jgi:hypothetical protein